MGFLFVLWRRETGRGAAVAVVWAAIFAALLGAVDEFHQQWIPGRSMDLLDWAADFAGGTAGASARPWRLRRSHSSSRGNIPPFPASSRIEPSFILAVGMRFRYVMAFEALNSQGGAT